MTDIALESFFLLHPDCKEIVAILLELLSRGVLVEEGIIDLLEALERSQRKQVKPFQGHALETGWKHSTHDEVVVGVDHHLDLISSEVLDGVGQSGVAIEARYHELLREPVGCDLLRKRRIGDPQDGGS